MNTDNLKKELDEFLAPEKLEKDIPAVESEIVITPKTGLVEKVDRTLLVPDGRQILTERYY